MAFSLWLWAGSEALTDCLCDLGFHGMCIKSAAFFHLLQYQQLPTEPQTGDVHA